MNRVERGGYTIYVHTIRHKISFYINIGLLIIDHAINTTLWVCNEVDTIN